MGVQDQPAARGLEVRLRLRAAELALPREREAARERRLDLAAATNLLARVSHIRALADDDPTGAREGVDAAIRNGLGRAAQTLRHMDWFEVTEIRGHLVDGVIDHVQVGMKVGFRLEDAQ